MFHAIVRAIQADCLARFRVGLVLVLRLGLGLGLVSGSSLVGVCRHLAAVVSVTYTTVVTTSCP